MNVCCFFVLWMGRFMLPFLHPRPVLPRSSGAAYRGNEVMRNLGRMKHWSHWTQMEARGFAWPSSCFPGSVSHMDKSPTWAHSHCRILTSLCFKFLQWSPGSHPSANLQLELPTKRNWPLGRFLCRGAHQNTEWSFLKICILTSRVHSGDAHPVGLKSKLCNSIIDNLVHSQLTSSSLEPIWVC